MTTLECVERDLRPVDIENASYRWGYLLLSYALLVDVMVRSIVYHEAAWDLMAAVIVSGTVCTAYQARQKNLAHGWVTKALLAACIAGVLAAILALSF